VLPVGSDDPPLFHGLKELEQAPAALRRGDRLPFPVLTLAEAAERVQIVVSWKDEAGPHHEIVHGAVAVRMAGDRILTMDLALTAVPTSVSAGRARP
jgi:hypothetical protein